MTTSPVTTLTDDLVAELEAAARESIYGCPTWLERDGYALGSVDDSDRNFIAAASPSIILDLLAELDELKRRAAQGDWLIEYMASERDDLDDTLMMGCSENKPHVLRSIIDNQMELLK